MLTDTAPCAGTSFDFDALRAKEFARLDEQNVAYLDFAGSGLYGASQVAAYADRLGRTIYGNPHSEHAPSLTSSSDLENARAAALKFFDADPSVYDVCFTANTSAALKLVGESYPFDARRGLVLSADNHNSVNGMREFARARGGRVDVLPLDHDMRLAEAASRITEIARWRGAGLLAFPVQSNFSGVKHPLNLIDAGHTAGFDVVIDAAGCGSLRALSLRQHPADFVAFSFYKMFGLPTGLGGLIAKHSAIEKLQRPWFAGGTVDFVSVELQRHQLRRGHEGFEDGTPNFLNVGAIEPGFALLQRVGRRALEQRVHSLSHHFLQPALRMAHSNGAPLFHFYGPRTLEARGATFAFNLLASDGTVVPYTLVETAARTAGVAIRGGCFCNPGAAEHAFKFADFNLSACLDRLGRAFSVDALQNCLGPDAVVGAVRLSIGLPSTYADIDRALVLASTFLD